MVFVGAILGLSYAWYSFTNSDIDVAGTTNSWCDGLDVTLTSGGSISNPELGAPSNSYNGVILLILL